MITSSVSSVDDSDGETDADVTFHCCDCDDVVDPWMMMSVRVTYYDLEQQVYRTGVIVHVLFNCC